MQPAREPCRRLSEPAVNERRHAAVIPLSIAAVERDTGLSKDTLRVWERRYGFPAPARSGSGERAYPPEQVAKLRVIKRLTDAGHRPGRIVALPLEALRRLAESTAGPSDGGAEATPAPPRSSRPPDSTDSPAPPNAPTPPPLRALLDLVRSHDLPALHAELARWLARLGVARFVAEVTAPLAAAIGDAWLQGRIEVYEEHACTETLHAVLRQALAALPEPPAGATPLVLLTTFPGEPHALGLLMAEAIIRLEGSPCVALGTETPAGEIALAASAYRAEIVALSFTGCLSPNRIADGLIELRSKLPAGVALWAGGSAPVLRRRRIEGVQAFDRVNEVPGELQRWRAAL